MDRRVRHLLYASVLVCAGCQSTPDNAPTQTAAETLVAAAPLEGTNWWGALGSPILDALVAHGQDEAFSVLLAADDLRGAEAASREVRAGLWPSLSGTVSDERRNSDADGFQEDSRSEAGLALSWQIDLFGQIRALSAARENTVARQQELLLDARRLIASQIVTSWLQLAALNDEIALADDSRARLSDAVGKVSRLTQAGYATKLDVARSEAQLREILARTAELEADREAVLNRLSFLTASGALPPGTGNESLPAVLPRLPMALPDAETLIAARPDIRAADAALLASASERAAARKRLLPDLSVQASLTTPIDVASGGLLRETVTRLSAPLLGRGQLLADIDRQDARLSAAHTRYRQTVSQAILEIDTAYRQTLILEDAVAERTAGRIAAETALAGSNRLFDAGEIGYLDVLIAEQALIDAARDEVAARRARALAWARYQAAVAR